MSTKSIVFPKHWGGLLPPHRSELVAEVRRQVIENNSTDTVVRELSQYTTDALLSMVPNTVRHVLGMDGDAYVVGSKTTRTRLVDVAMGWISRPNREYPNMPLHAMVTNAYTLPLSIGYCVHGTHSVSITGDFGVPRILSLPSAWQQTAMMQTIPTIFQPQSGVCEAHERLACSRCGNAFELLKVEQQYITRGIVGAPNCNTCCSKLLMYVPSTFKVPKLKLPKVVPWAEQYAGPEVPATTPNPLPEEPPQFRWADTTRAMPSDEVLRRLRDQMITERAGWRRLQTNRAVLRDPEPSSVGNDGEYAPEGDSLARELLEEEEN